jgi:uncharacterized protein
MNKKKQDKKRTAKVVKKTRQDNKKITHDTKRSIKTKNLIKKKKNINHHKVAKKSRIIKKDIHKSIKSKHNNTKPKQNKKILIHHKKSLINKTVSRASKNKGAKKNKSEKKIIVVHGWEGGIDRDWFPWLKKTLESQGFKVIMEQMPTPDHPKIDEWTATLKNISGAIDEQTYFIGHSIGCQTIIRMLEKHEAEKVGGAVFLAGWFTLTEHTFKEDPQSEEKKRMIAKPWLEEEIDFENVQSRFNPGKIVAIFSDNDPYVDITNAEKFKQKFGARILIESGKGHYTQEDNITSVPIIIEELLRMINQKNDS